MSHSIFLRGDRRLPLIIFFSFAAQEQVVCFLQFMGLTSYLQYSFLRIQNRFIVKFSPPPSIPFDLLSRTRLLLRFSLIFFRSLLPLLTERWLLGRFLGGHSHLSSLGYPLYPTFPLRRFSRHSPLFRFGPFDLGTPIPGNLSRLVDGSTSLHLTPLLEFRKPTPFSANFSLSPNFGTPNPPMREILIELQRPLMFLRYLPARYFFYYHLPQSLLRSRFCRSGSMLRSLSLFFRLMWELSPIRHLRNRYRHLSSMGLTTFAFRRLPLRQPISDSILMVFLRFGDRRFAFHPVRKGAAKVSVPVLARYHDSLKFLLRSQWQLSSLGAHRSLTARVLLSFFSLLNFGPSSGIFELIRSIWFYSRYNRIDTLRFVHRRRSGARFHVPRRSSLRGIFRGSGYDSIFSDPALSLHFLRHATGFYSPFNTLPK